jgi:hypothetical protein
VCAAAVPQALLAAVGAAGQWTSARRLQGRGSAPVARSQHSSSLHQTCPHQGM